MYNEQLEKLIELALVDSVITASERAVIRSKAEVLGISADEINMVLDAKIAEKKQQETAKSRQVFTPIDTKNYTLDSPIPTNALELRTVITFAKGKAASDIAIFADWSNSENRRNALAWIAKYNTLVDQATRVIDHDPDYVRKIKNGKQSLRLQWLYLTNKGLVIAAIVLFCLFLVIYLPIAL